MEKVGWRRRGGEICLQCRQFTRKGFGVDLKVECARGQVDTVAVLSGRSTMDVYTCTCWERERTYCTFRTGEKRSQGHKWVDYTWLALGCSRFCRVSACKHWNCRLNGTDSGLERDRLSSEGEKY